MPLEYNNETTGNTIAETLQYQKKAKRLLSRDERADASAAEKQILAKAVKQLVKFWRGNKG